TLDLDLLARGTAATVSPHRRRLASSSAACLHFSPRFALSPVAIAGHHRLASSPAIVASPHPLPL
ncbi:hypothetical protein PIB30_046857, partial [Stylosanthes scabra]|nr:hypothetical protein [Stylosanthes scabra]